MNLKAFNKATQFMKENKDIMSICINSFGHEISISRQSADSATSTFVCGFDVTSPEEYEDSDIASKSKKK